MTRGEGSEHNFVIYYCESSHKCRPSRGWNARHVGVGVEGCVGSTEMSLGKL